MKSRILLMGAMGAAVLAAGCGGSDNGSGATTPPSSTTPPTSSTMALDTAQVLALAQVTSETSSPFAVNAGALTLTDTSNTTAPISVSQ